MPDRMKIVSSCHFYFISKNLKNLEEIKKDVTKLSNPLETSDREAKKIIESLPAIAWMASQFMETKLLVLMLH